MSKEKGSNRLLIVDGQQRLLSLYSFYKGKFKDQEFRLVGVQNDLSGKPYKDLAVSDRNRLDDPIIHSTVVRQDVPDDNESSIYQIFERLNSGGRPPSPQEIRACIYYGDYNLLLSKLTNDPHWRMIFGKCHDERLREEELILRFFSFYYDLEFYEKPLKDFLNKRMAANRNLQFHSKSKLTNLFKKTTSFIETMLGKNAFRIERGIHTAVFDSIMIATGKRLENSDIKDAKAYRDTYSKLLNNDVYKKLIGTGTSDENSIKNRINLAIDLFATVK